MSTYVFECLPTPNIDEWNCDGEATISRRKCIHRHSYTSKIQINYFFANLFVPNTETLTILE